MPSTDDDEVDEVLRAFAAGLRSRGSRVDGQPVVGLTQGASPILTVSLDGTTHRLHLPRAVLADGLAAVGRVGGHPWEASSRH